MDVEPRRLGKILRHGLQLKPARRIELVFHLVLAVDRPLQRRDDPEPAQQHQYEIDGGQHDGEKHQCVVHFFKHVIVVIDSDQFQRMIGHRIEDDEALLLPDVSQAASFVPGQPMDMGHRKLFSCSKGRRQHDSLTVADQKGEILLRFLYRGSRLQKTKRIAADAFVIIAQILLNLPAQDRQDFDGILILAVHESIPGIAGGKEDRPANNHAEQRQQQ